MRVLGRVERSATGSSSTCARSRPRPRPTRPSSRPRCGATPTSWTASSSSSPARSSHPGLRAIVTRVLLATTRSARVAAAPARRGDHHSYAGGLLEHTVGVATICRETAQLHPRLRADLLLAAALLHDVGRALELTARPDLPPDRRGPPARPRPPRPAPGRGARAAALDATRAAELLHAIACHHDARAARTAEAAVLYHANQLDAVAATRPVPTQLASSRSTRSIADFALGREPDVGLRRLLRAAQGTDARRAARPRLRGSVGGARS